MDVAFDVQKDWPFPDDSASEIYASHLLEHLSEPKAFFREAWRVLRPMGQMLLRLPYGGHRSAWWDLEHVRPWYAETFCFLQPGYARSVGNPQHDAWRWPFAIHRIDVRLSGRFAPWLRRRWLRRWLVPYLDCIPECAEELYVYGSPLKTDAAQQEYLATHVPNSVPCQYILYRHHAEGRSQPDPKEALSFMSIGELDIIARFRNWPQGGR